MTILILHGWAWPSGSQSWSSIRQLLEDKGINVFLPDLPGFGANPAPVRPWSVDDYVKWIRSFCEKNNLSQIFLLGHSFGGSLAIKFSLKYPEKIKKLILVDSAGIRKKSIKKQAVKKIAKFFKIFSFLPFYSLIRKALYRFVFQSDYLAVEGTMKETYFNVIKEDISANFSNITVPTLLIWGRKDKLTPLEHAYFMKEKIPQARLEIIPNIRHNPHSEAPEILAEKILNFIE